MPVLATLYYAVLMLSLALIVKWEFVRRRKGPSLKPGGLDQLNSPRLRYTPPPDRPRRYLYPVRQSVR